MGLRDFQTDPAREAGVPIVFADYGSPRLTLARATSNQRLKLEFERLTRDLRDKVGSAAEAERERAWLVAFCRVCIVRWESLVRRTEEGKPDTYDYADGIDLDGLVAFSPERAVEVFEVRGLEAFREQVIRAARADEHYRNQSRQADTGN